MKILILGAKGNLGQQLTKVFEKNYNIFALDRDELDITNKNLVYKRIKDIKPKIIINSVAYNAVDKCESKDGFESAKKINGDAVGYLAEAAIKNNTILIHYSSDYVFDGEEKKGYMENDNPNSISKYGETKLMGERAIIEAEGNGLKYYIIRTSKLFGPKGESEVAKPSFFDIMLKLAKEKEKIDIINEEISCFTYTPDLAKATKELIETGKKYGIYHIVNSGPCTWYEATKELFKFAKINIKINPIRSDKFPRLAKRPKYSILLNTKLKPMRDWKLALREYIKTKK